MDIDQIDQIIHKKEFLFLCIVFFCFENEQKKHLTLLKNERKIFCYRSVYD